MQITFDKVSLPFTKKVPCSTCGRSVRRSKTFYQTLNPFNRDDTGAPKSREQIVKELAVSGKAWSAEGETCRTCIDAALSSNPAAKEKS